MLPAATESPCPTNDRPLAFPDALSRRATPGVYGQPMVRPYGHRDFDAGTLLEAKGAQRIAVCLPARNEQSTVGTIVGRVREALVQRVPLVDEVLVMDDSSTDATARIAQDAGALVVDASSTLAEHGTGPGKGMALWKS